MKKSPTLIVTGGGTGGHVFAGVSIADEWKKNYPTSRILFIGAQGAIEEKTVPRAGYPLELLSLGALKGVSIGKRISTLIKIPFALLKSLFILIRERPSAVVGVGGYASGPVVLMAWLVGWIWGCRIGILEQNAVPGLTNRLLGGFANQVFCAFPGIDQKFDPKKALVTGNPIRKEIQTLPAAPRTPFSIFIFGGSQGAMGINTLVLEMLPLIQDLKGKVEITHQTGDRDYDRVKAGYEKAGFPARVEKFIHDMQACYAKASVVICRSGSSTLAELAAVGRAAILIPFPQAADNHQEKNARLFEEAQAVKVLLQGKSKGSDLEALIRSYVKDATPLQEMENRIKKFHTHSAAHIIVKSIHPSTEARGLI